MFVLELEAPVRSGLRMVAVMIRQLEIFMGNTPTAGESLATVAGGMSTFYTAEIILNTHGWIRVDIGQCTRGHERHALLSSMTRPFTHYFFRTQGLARVWGWGVQIGWSADRSFS